MENVVAAILNQVFLVVSAIIASGWITNAITELLKIKQFKQIAKKFPVPVAVLTSLIVSALSFFVLNLVELTTWVTYVVYFAGTLAVATLSYDGIIKKFKDDGTVQPIETHVHGDVNIAIDEAAKKDVQ